MKNKQKKLALENKKKFEIQMINEENSGSPAKSHSSENEVGSDTEPVSAKKKKSSGSADVEDNGSVASGTSLQNEEEIKEQ